MLKPAQLYSEQLKKLFCEIAYDEKYMYYNTNGYSDEYQPTTSTWNCHEFVSVNKKGEVIGYIKYSVDRRANNAHSLAIINFTNDSVTFGMDVAHVIDDIFAKYKFYKVMFSVFVGNPIEKSYDKMCMKYGGSITGTCKGNVILLDGNRYDEKMYEILREDYMKNRRERQWI